MKKSGVIMSTIILAAGVAATLIVEHQSRSRLLAREARMREQQEQLSGLAQEQERLLKAAARATNPPPDNSAAEVAKLRSEIAALKQRTNELSRASASKQNEPAEQSDSTPIPHTPEYYQQLRALAGSKPVEVRDLGRAFSEYAFDHQNQGPTSLDQLSPYLANFGAKLSGSNQYELIYHGTLEQLNGLPWGSIAVVRDTQPWPGPDGTMMRVYGFPGGMSQMIIDNLQPWLSEHVIAPQNSETASH